MVWTPAQTAAFLDRVQADRLYPLWHIIAHRGLRRGEAVHLLWADVDLDAAQATIREQADDEMAQHGSEYGEMRVYGEALG
jgi:integrase